MHWGLPLQQNVVALALAPEVEAVRWALGAVMPAEATAADQGCTPISYTNVRGGQPFCLWKGHSNSGQTQGQCSSQWVWPRQQGAGEGEDRWSQERPHQQPRQVGIVQRTKGMT